MVLKDDASVGTEEDIFIIEARPMKVAESVSS